MSGRRHIHHRAPMVSMTQGDDFRITGVNTSQDHCRFVGFSTTVGEETFLQIARRKLRNFFGKVYGLLIEIKRRGMSNPGNLFADSLNDFGVSMTYGGCEHAAETIEIGIARAIPNVHTLAVRERDRVFVICGGASPAVFLMF